MTFAPAKIYDTTILKLLPIARVLQKLAVIHGCWERGGGDR